MGPVWAFKSKLELDLEKHKKTLVDVGTCPLHIASNAFREGLKTLTIELGIDLDQIVLDLFGFFKYSTKRIAEYLMPQSLHLLRVEEY